MIAFDAMTQLRAVEHATRLIERTYRHLHEYLRPGLTEREIASEIRRTLRTLGAKNLSYRSIVGAGPGGAEPHHVPGTYRIRRGNFIVMDFAPKIAGWCADQTRTFLVGKPTTLQRKRYDLVLRAQRTAMRAIRPGVESHVIDDIARRVITKAGYGKLFIHSTGHGIGKRIHTPPWLTPNPRRSRKLRAGDTITVEPGIYDRRWGGIRIEDMVLVTRTGYRLLTKRLPTDLTRLTIT